REHESKNRLSTLFLSEEKADSSPCHDRDGSRAEFMHIDKGLKDEAQFLKPCGTTVVTPIEIRKASEKLETPERAKHFTSSQLHSWTSSNSDAAFHLDEKTDELCGEVSEQTPSSCMTDARSSTIISTGYSDAGEESIGTTFRDGVDRTSEVPLTAGNITGKRNSVRFECDFDKSYSSSSSQISTSYSKVPEKDGKSKFSATSLKLSDEIQTPGTIFPANMESAVREKRTQIRSQFVHSASNLIENASICKLPEDADESLQPAKVQACKEKTENESPTSAISEGKLEESSDEKYQTCETNISPTVKQSHEKSNKNMAALPTITLGDRPIIGMVAAHWNEKEQSQISPKWWDGNGIPNSTNKYKEDQKVSWHATSFEERLEKALSEEGGQGFIPSRKIGIIKEAERDTAISEMHHSSQS
ncbi:hypothetical protein EUTSA_v10017740mg, partial [Eutrema salsugineum]